MFRSKVTLTLAAMAGVLALATGCTPAEGPAGSVIDRDRTVVGKTARHYYLTVRTTAGREHKFQVLRNDYNACLRGSAYPKCAH